MKSIGVDSDTPTTSLQVCETSHSRPESHGDHNVKVDRFAACVEYVRVIDKIKVVYKTVKQ